MKTKKRKSKPVTSANPQGSAELCSTDGLGINGLFLWSVRTNHTTPSTGNLWITTKTPSAKLAAEKAVRFMRQTLGPKTEVLVVRIKSKGTLDA